MTTEPELVCVQVCPGMDLAQIYKSKLEAWDIPVLLEYDSAGKLFGLTLDGLGEVRVMVPQAYASEAESLLAEGPYQDDPEEEPDPEDDSLA